MPQVQDPRLPLTAQAGRGSDEAPIALASFNGRDDDDASLAFRNEPEELLGLSAGLTPMSMSSSGPGTLAKSPAPGRQVYTSDTPSDYNFPHDLNLVDTQGSQQNWVACQVTDSSNDNVADPLQRLASAEPEQPWSGIHLNGVPPSQRPDERVQRPSSNSKTTRTSWQRSTIRSHANETDEGYYTYSQPDLRSMYSDDSGQVHQARPGQSSVPRTIPSAQGQSRLVNYGINPFHRTPDLQLVETMEAQNSSQPPQEPIRCLESGCSFTSKTMSDFKKHEARHKREHVCDQPKCPRAEKGFATINDLERHQKTVHGIEPVRGQSRMYKCFSPSCKQAEKEWPRLDNFKQHLVRMHGSENTQGLIQRSNEWYDTEKKPPQSAPGSQSRDQRYGFEQAFEPSPPRPQSHNYLSPHWRPTATLAGLQQAKPQSRPRHSSFSSQPNPSSSSSPFGVPSFRASRRQDMHSIGGNQHDHKSVDADPTQWSSEDPFVHSDHIPHGRLTSAYTVPNPNTSALSDLPYMSFPTYPVSLATAQDDLAQIASNFPSEQQRNLPPSDADLPAPPAAANVTRQPSQQRTFSMEAIRALIDGGNERQNVAVLERIMKAGIEKLNESKRLSAATTTTATNTTSSSSAPPSVVTSTLTSGADSTGTCLPYRCPEAHCTKAFSRPCDLKKHLKRHHRPYGCTFSRCSEKFGSKYDWKRHETSRHFQQECWRCHLCSSGTAAPGGSLPSSSAQLFYRRHLYEGHLRTVHYVPQEKVREHVRKQRIGRNCRSRFWCGFCEKIVVLTEKGLKGANERFNHIDDHFKKKRRIETWVNIDGSVAKGQQEVEREDQDEDDESVEDVLGGDGISGAEVRRAGGNDEAREEDDSSSVGTGPRAGAGAGTVQLGQKRAFGSDFDFSSSTTDVRPKCQRRTDDPDPAPATAYFFVCHQCGNGPWNLPQTSQCPLCQHICCRSCTYEKRRDTQWPVEDES